MKAFILLFFLLIFNAAIGQKNVQLLGHLPYNVDLSDIWGYEDGIGNEYALIGIKTGVSIVDISTDPSSPSELFRFTKSSSTWWDLKTYNGYCYVVNETGGGLFIIDLQSLPSQADTFSWHGDANYTFKTAHNLFIDEKGYGYLFGFNKNATAGGAVIIDLNADPINPPILGFYDDGYVHDGYVRGDTLWGSEVYNGWFSVVDVSNRAAPVLLATHSTPSDFTHNCWLSGDGNTLFTTDEKADAFIASYDVSDIYDISELDRYQSDPGTGVIPHNTFWIDSFLVNSYYRDGITVVDAHKPDNLVETGYYDTSPFTSGPGFQGSWGVYPYFSSGKIVASDMQEGLFVLQPQYKRAAYLEGEVSQVLTNVKITGAKVEIMTQDKNSYTNILGIYRSGVADSGNYDVRFTHPNCFTKIVSGVHLSNGNTTILNVELTCPNLDIATTGTEELAFRAISGTDLNIYYSLPEIYPDARIILSDINGRAVREINISGTGTVTFTGSLPAGIYLATLQAMDLQKTIKVVKAF